MLAMYTPRHLARTHSLALRQGHYFLRSWGSPASEQPLLLLLHGWMDVGASFQFMVDALPSGWLADRHVVALDWRGFGHTRMPACEHYLFADYLADLDALLDQLSPQQPVDLLGHSMGANAAMLYAGVRPQRVRRLVNLEGFGLPASPCERAPDHLARWLDALQARRQGSHGLRSYASVDQVVQRLRHNNPVWLRRRPNGWLCSGRRRQPMGAGTCWPMSPTSCPAASAMTSTKCWRFGSASGRRC